MARARGAEEVPDAVAPMLAVPGEPPPGWAYEFKWDGVRCCYRVGPAGTTRMTSRNGNDITRSYPELEGLLTPALAGRGAVLDGEIVALNAKGRPDFSRLQQRMHQRAPSAALLARTPVLLYVFDVLVLDGRPVLGEPYERRRELLDQLDLRSVRGLAVPACHSDVDGRALLDIARDNGLEGVVAKRPGSAYEPGRRSPAWVKTPLLRTQEVVLAGWKPGEGRRAGTIGSILLGAHDPDGKLVYIGHVGTGFSESALADLMSRFALLARRTSPFDEPVPREHAVHARWLTPYLVGEVVYRTWTPDHRLRHAAWRGLRQDKLPREVTTPAPS